jgi:nitrite reductase/ring-hydroxylating ferredoxin subunit
MTQKIFITNAADLSENQSVKFAIPAKPEPREGFAIRHNGVVTAFYNECAHIPLPLDWDDNDFFTHDFKRIVCKNHGAEYDTQSGICKVGPCVGAHLKKIEVVEDADALYALIKN